MGRDTLCIVTVPLLRCFNPRAHVGRDEQQAYYKAHDNKFQSTRPRGARLHMLLTELRRAAGFQSTRPRGARHGKLLGSGFMRMFQSTRPRGARRDSVTFYNRLESFNPRAHVGRDCFLTLVQSYDKVSIHAPTWGATFRRVCGPMICKVSIHAPTWGATLRSATTTVASK